MAFFNHKIKAHLVLHTPIKAKGVRKSTVSLHDNPELFLLLIELFKGWQKGTMEAHIPRKQWQTLRDMGVFATSAEDLPADVSFECPLNAQALPALLPATGVKPNPSDPWVLSPWLTWQTTAEPPERLKSRLKFYEYLSPNRPLLWVEDPQRRMLNPYWFANPETLNWLKRLHQGQCQPSELPQPLFVSLVLAQILVTAEQLTQNALMWQQQVQSWAEFFRDNGYVVIQRLLNPVQIAAMRHYCRQIEAEGYCLNGDPAVKLRKWLYKDTLMLFLQGQLEGVIRQIVQAEALPTYPFLSVYLPTAVLKRHTDRPECKWNLSVALDENPTFGPDKKWPLYFEIQGQVHEAHLQMGDAVLYSGTDHEHWREPLDEHHKVGVGIFHFVPPGFSGDLI